MAKRQKFRETPFETSVPIEVPSPIRMAGTEAWVDTLIGVNNQVNGFLDRAAQEEGKKSGALAGVERDEDGNLNFRTVSGATIRGRSFNAAGQNSYAAALKSQASTRLSEIYRETKHDPKALGIAMDSYEKGVKASVTEQSPESIGIVEAQFASMKAPYMNASLDIAERQLLDDASTEITATANTMVQDTSFAMRNMTDRSAAMQYAVERRAELYSMMVQNGPKAEFSTTSLVKGDMEDFAADGQRTGVFSAKDIATNMKAFDDEVKSQQMLWGYDQASKINGGGAYIRNFMAAKDPSMTPEQKDKITKSLFAEMSQRNRVESQASAAAKAEQTARWDLTERRETILLLEGQGDVKRYEDLIIRDDMNPDLARQFAETVRKGGPGTDDAGAILEYNVDGLENVSENDIARDDRLTFDTRKELILDRRKIVDDAENWRKTQEGGEAVRRIKGEFGILGQLESALDLTGEEKRKVNRVLTNFYNQVEKLPLEEREGEAVKIADELIKGIRSGEANADIQRLQEQLDDPDNADTMGFSSIAEIDAAIADGDDRLVNFIGSPRDATVNRIKQNVELLERGIRNKQRGLGNVK